jgi:hypothetical protein
MLAIGGTAGAATVQNGTFEGGPSLPGWKKDFFGPGAWSTYTGVFGGDTMRGMGANLTVPAPPQSEHGAISSQDSPSAAFLSQKVKLKANRRHKLRFQLAYANQNVGSPILRGDDFGNGFFTPNHFRFGKAARPNQQFRMDVMKPGADIRSLDKGDILEEVYITERGDPNRRTYRPISANLSDLAGKTVRLRFATVVTEEELNVGIDAVKVKTKRLR